MLTVVLFTYDNIIKKIPVFNNDFETAQWLLEEENHLQPVNSDIVIDYGHDFVILDINLN